MKFKNEQAEADYAIMPKKLREIVDVFETFALYFGVTPVITRIRDREPGDSGVHEAGRGLDIRDETFLEGGVRVRVYSSEQVKQICQMINERYPRPDSKLTCIHHSFNGGPEHFHIQLYAGWLEKGEPLPRTGN